MKNQIPGSVSVILAIETSHRQGSVAAGRPLDPPLVELFTPGLVHGREIITRIDRLSHRARFARSEIGLVAVSAGPGSYTGIRIGVSAAKALSWALHCPALAVSTLEVIARNVTEMGEFAVILDARRGACYAASFRRGEEGIVRLDEDRLLPPDRFLEELPTHFALVGEGTLAFSKCERFSILPPECNVPRADHVHAIAAAQWPALAEGRGSLPPEFLDPHTLMPRYLRPSQAEEREGG